MMRKTIVRVAASILGVLTLVAMDVSAGASPGIRVSQRGAPASEVPITFEGETLALSTVAAASSSPISGPRESVEVQEVLRSIAEHNPREEDEADGEPYEPRLGPALPHSTLKIKTPSVPPQSFEGLNHLDNRYSDGGNQFSGIPPDQGLCAGNGLVLEVVNSVLQIYAEDGTPQLPGQALDPGAGAVGVSLNQFYGLPHSFQRPAGPFGPYLYDPSCLYDSASQRWFVVSADLESDPVTGDFTGYSRTYLAVSTSADPTGTWNVWYIDTTNNGQNGTPDHGCESGFCFGDYPQIGIDNEGLYITTNEFDVFELPFNGAQLYALSTDDLVAGTPVPDSVYFQNLPSTTNGGKAYSIIPVNQVAADRDLRAGGTAYFVMRSDTWRSKPSRKMSLWALTNTDSLGSGTPSLVLFESPLRTEKMFIPWYMKQKKGPSPVVECQNIGKSCYGAKVPQQYPPAVLDAVADRVSGAWRQGGQIYVTVTTALKGHGSARLLDGRPRNIGEKVGLAYLVLDSTDPSLGPPAASVARQGYIGVENNNLAFSSIVVDASGNAVIGASLMGPDRYPSAVYIPMPAGQKPTKVFVAARGRAPEDDFGSADYGGWTRWGDYPAAAIGDDGSIWLANEYVQSRCQLQEWIDDSTCGYTRSYFANWSTRITRIVP